MNNDYKSPAFKKLLDSLQQQSWELELLISGFAIFGLFSAYEPLELLLVKAANDGNSVSISGYFVLLISCYILLFNLILHVILRGLWIGALGLRYVSGDIDFEQLRYTEKFKNYLSKKIVSFDRYIGNLENYCSVLFAISFLLIFYVLAFAIIMATITATSYLMSKNQLFPKWLNLTLGIPILLFLTIGMVLTFIDFVTQGLLKRNKWVAKVYFPFYWVFSFLSLSFIYRPLIYNFLDNKFGRKLILLLTPAYFIILSLTSLSYKNSNFLDSNSASSQNFANEKNYFDMLSEDIDFPGMLVLPSKIIRTPYLQLFVPYNAKLEDAIFKISPDLKPEKDRRGWSSDFMTGVREGAEMTLNKSHKDSLFLIYMEEVNKLYHFSLDTTMLDGELLATQGKKGKIGFETLLPLGDLSEGKHTISLMFKENDNDSIFTTIKATVPFWYYKE